MLLETILQQLTQTQSFVPVTIKENAWMNQTRMKTMTMMMNDLDELAESGTVRWKRIKIDQNYLMRLFLGLEDWPPRSKADS